MERVLDWNLRRYLVWETEKPFKERPRESPLFSFQGRMCSLTLSVSQEFSERCYRLKIKSESGFEAFQACNVTVHVKRRTGVIALSQTCAHRWWEPSSSLWGHYESDILKELRDFDSEGLLRFFIFFDDYTVENTLCLKSLKDKAVQTNEKPDPEGEIISHCGEKSVQTPLYLNSHTCMEELSADFSKLLDESTSPHDVKLKCGEHTIGAHRNVLSARSQVFAKMLASDMAEGRTGLVEIQDMDFKILGHFLRYLYTGMLPELNANTAKEFYEAGDKYAIEGLTRRCSDFLQQNLTLENACDVLVLADAHNDRHFRENVITYIVDKEIPLKDEHFLDLSTCHPKLANEVLIRFCKLQSKLQNPQGCGDT